MSTLLARRRRRTEINIVPLIDVLTILIFFFLVSMQFREQKVLQITMPKILSAGENDATDMLVVAINREGQVFVNGTPATEAELVGVARGVAQANAETPVLLQVDQDTPVKNVMSVMDACRGAGLNRIRFQSRGSR